MTPTYDTASSNVTTSGSSLTWTHTTTTDNYRVMLIHVSVRNGRSVTAVTYNSVSALFVRSDQPGADVHTELWWLPSPATGANTVSVTINATDEILAGAVTFSNARGIGASVGGGDASNTATSSSLSITGLKDDIAVDIIGLQANRAGLTPGGSQTQRWTQNTTNQICAVSTQTLTDDTTATWTWTGSTVWAGSAVVVNPMKGNIGNEYRYVQVGDGMGRSEGAT